MVKTPRSKRAQGAVLVLDDGENGQAAAGNGVWPAEDGDAAAAGAGAGSPKRKRLSEQFLHRQISSPPGSRRFESPSAASAGNGEVATTTTPAAPEARARASSS